MSPVRVRFFTRLLATATSLVLVTGAREVLAQADLGDPITLSNSSFEDIPRQAQAPRGWYDCGFSGETPVDVHPASVLDNGSQAFFEVNNQAFDGNTYLGMVVRDNETYEAVSQRLIGGPLVAGKCYTFSIYLARAANYVSNTKLLDVMANYDTPVKLRIWGGSSYCNRREIIAESAPVKNTNWLQYNFRFEPKSDHAYLLFEAYYKTPMLFPYNGNLLLDMAGKIVPTPCDEDIPEQPLSEPIVANTPTPKPVAPRPTPRPDSPAAKPATNTNVASNAATTRPGSTQRPPAAETRLQGLTVRDLREGDIIRLERLYFKADSSAINPGSVPLLNEIYSFLKANPNVVIEVGGHTNGRPPDEFCDKLSAARAEAVVEYLNSKGIERIRLFARGYGKREPIASNATELGRKKNQRVEIKVLKVG